MLALTVVPREADSARVEEVAEPAAKDGAVLVETLAVGMCGTDIEIIEGRYGWAPPGCDRLTIGHESVGRVVEAPKNSGLSAGDLIAGIVRRPDPVPCPNCAVGEWDMCRNGLYVERGIKQRNGYCSKWFRIEPEYSVKVAPDLQQVGVLVEPARVVAKAWEHIEKIARRAQWEPSRVLVTGAGPIGLLAALMGVERGLDVHVLDRITEGPKPALVRDLGATYHTGSVAEACRGTDIVIECTGAGWIVFDAMQHTTAGGIVCLTGISSGGRDLRIDAAALNRTIVLENDVVFGTVNANRRHYEAAAMSLAKADRHWLSRLISRRVALAHWADAVQRRPADVKTVIDMTL
ncbi:MAG: glucose 1-dehydrogenase [Candidatus Binatia bacterium]